MDRKTFGHKELTGQRCSGTAPLCACAGQQDLTWIMVGVRRNALLAMASENGGCDTAPEHPTHSRL